MGIDRGEERERDRVGVDCLGLGKAEEGSPGWCSGEGLFSVFNGRIITFDYCTCMSGCEPFCCLFLDLVNCKPLFPSERLLSPRVSARARSNRENNSVNVNGHSTTIAYTRRSIYRGCQLHISKNKEAIVVGKPKE